MQRVRLFRPPVIEGRNQSGKCVLISVDRSSASTMKKASLNAVKQPATRVHASGATFPIVGIGASAGGLEAFTELLTALPLDTGMAFVLIQHLEAEHESMLTELLSKVTQMPVTEVRKATHVDPNHVYVIPANADLSLAHGAIRVSARKAAA